MTVCLKHLAAAAASLSVFFAVPLSASAQSFADAVAGRLYVANDGPVTATLTGASLPFSNVYMGWETAPTGQKQFASTSLFLGDAVPGATFEARPTAPFGTSDALVFLDHFPEATGLFFVTQFAADGMPAPGSSTPHPRLLAWESDFLVCLR